MPVTTQTTTGEAVIQPESDARGLEERVAAIGRELAQTLRMVLEAIPGEHHRPKLLAKRLGVNTVLTSRLLKAIRENDPIAVAHTVPGPEPLRRVLKSAQKTVKVDRDLIRAAEKAVDRFDALIHTEAGDRGSLDAIISGWLPDARKKIELLSKQAMFKGVSQLLGVAADTEHQTAIFWPSNDGHHLDLLWIVGHIGLRRLRPGVAVKYDNRTMVSGEAVQTLDGKPVEGFNGLVLEPFCSTPIPKFEVSRVREAVHYLLAGNGVGTRSAVNVVHALLRPKFNVRYRDPSDPKRKSGASVAISVPLKTLIFDVLLHHDVYPGSEPALGLYRTVFDGLVNPNDPERDVDRLEIEESIRFLGQADSSGSGGHGLARFRATEIPKYEAMIQYVCDKRGWSTEALRGYRCRIEFPMYSSQITIAFDLPEAPGND